MKKNAAIPFGLIAVIGIVLVIVISFIGVNQRDEIRQAEEGGTEQAEEQQAEEGETVTDAEAIFESNCASCHGGDLSGGVGPDLTKVGSKLSMDEIQGIIIKGTDGGMPGGLVDDAQAEALAKWLSEMK